jgi:hypothetical protein
MATAKAPSIDVKSPAAAVSLVLGVSQDILVLGMRVEWRSLRQLHSVSFVF